MKKAKFDLSLDLIMTANISSGESLSEAFKF